MKDESNLAEFYEKRVGWRGFREEDMRFRKAVKIAEFPADGSFRLLDIGCRDGRLRKFLPESVEYHGIDIAPSFQNESIVTGDISDGTNFPDDYFDYAFCIEVLEHTKSPFTILREVHRILRKEGTFVLSVPNPYHFKEIIWNLFRVKDRQGHMFSWTRQAMVRMAEFAGFQVEYIEGTYFHPPIPSKGLLSRSFIYRLRPAKE
jgi:SAM-dependent methyltransferase